MAFVSSVGAGVFCSSAQRSLRSICTPGRPSRPYNYSYGRRVSPCMMAKYQERDVPESPAESEGTVDKFIPPVQLPTLNTLAGGGVPGVDEKDGIDLSLLNSTDENEIAQQQDLAQMGVSLSKEEEFKAVEFLKNVYEEFLTLDWPDFGRVVKITIIVILSIIFSAVAIYFVDGFFLSLSQYLFDIPAV